MTQGEVAASEGMDETELLSLLADRGFQELVEMYRLQDELPEDERERLLIDAAFEELWHLAHMGDAKAALGEE